MTKGKIIRILVVGILVLAIPLTVRLAQQQQIIKSRAAEATGSISATPCTIPSGQTLCTSTITWSTNNADAQKVKVVVGRGSAGGTLQPFFNCGTSGHQDAPWIDSTGFYFYLMNAPSCNGVDVKEAYQLNSVFVRGTTSAPTAPSPGVPIVFTDEPTGVRGDGALLAATVNPNRAATDVWFRYGGGAGFENSTCLGLPASSTTKSIPTGPDDVKVYIPIYGMANGSKVFFCAVAKNSENSAGITYGDKRSFVTSSSGGGGSVPSSDLFLSISPNPVDSGQKVTLRGTAAAKCRAPYALSEGGGLISCAEPEVTFCSSGNPCEVKKVCTAGSPGTYTASFVETDCVSTSQSYTVNPSGSLCTSKPKGDANEDGKVDLLDFNIWRDEFIMEAGGSLTIRRADFNCSGKVDIVDFNIWLSGVNL